MIIFRQTSIMVKKIFLFLLVVFIIIQFIHPEKNQSTQILASDITHVVAVPDSVMGILKVACYDCHSNNTRYPWYNNIQPVAWWLHSHIKDAKEGLNFSEFGNYAPAKKKKRFNGIAKLIDKDEMPLSSYTLIHRDAKLDARQKEMMISWAKNSAK